MVNASKAFNSYAKEFKENSDIDESADGVLDAIVHTCGKVDKNGGMTMFIRVLVKSVNFWKTGSWEKQPMKSIKNSKMLGKRKRAVDNNKVFGVLATDLLKTFDFTFHIC